MNYDFVQSRILGQIGTAKKKIISDEINLNSRKAVFTTKNETKNKFTNRNPSNFYKLKTQT